MKVEEKKWLQDLDFSTQQKKEIKVELIIN